MNSLRKILFFLMVFTFAAFALPASAHYATLVMTAGAPGTLTAKITNTSPNGPYTINSLKVPFGTNVGGIGGVTVSAYSPGGTFPTVSASGGNILIPSGISLARNQSITLTLSGVTTSPPGCTPKSTQWTVKAYEDANYGGYLYQVPSTGSTLNVTLSPACYTIAASAGAGGGIAPAGNTQLASGGSQTYTITPNANYHVASVLVDGVSAGTVTSYTFSNVTANRTISATFAINTFTLTYTPGANGTISGTSPQTVNYLGSGTAVSANPSIGYHFVNWSDGSTANPRTDSGVTADLSVTANFAINNYSVSFNSNGGTPVASQDVQYGNYASVPSPAPTRNLYAFAGWYGDAALTTAFNFAGTAITGPTTIYAKWTANLMTITGPTSAAAGEPFPITVSLTGPTSVTLSVSAGCTMIPPAPLLVPVTGNPMTFNVKIAATVPPSDQTCGITISASGYPDTTLPGLKVYKGVLDCGDYDSVNGPGDSTYDPDLPSTDPSLGSSYVGTPGWGLKRGPNKDGAACVKINYSCNLDATANVASCTYDKIPGQQAAFKYLFLWAPKPPDASGWTNYRPQVSWGVAAPSLATTLPDWVPLVACINDLFPSLPTLPTTILPTIPGVAPFTDAGNTLPQYQPSVTALVCGGQQGWTAVGSPGNPLIQIWNIIIDEADLKVAGPQ